MPRVAALIVTALLLWATQTSPALAERVALVIGNAAYERSPLKNPKNDAEHMAALLGRLGFRVELVLNADKAAMDAGLSWLSRNATGADTAALFYSGHGIEMDGKNYLIPLRAPIFQPEDVAAQAVELGAAMRLMGGARRLKLAFVDACRDNGLFPTKSGFAKGLAPQPFTSGRMIMSFATQPGHVADDGLGDLSPFTQSLAEALERNPHGELRVSLTQLEPRVRQLARLPQSPRSEYASDFAVGEHVSLTGEKPQGLILDACSTIGNLAPGQRCVRRPDGGIDLVMEAPPPGGGPPGGSPWRREAVRRPAGEARIALTLAHDGPVRSVAFNPDGSLLLTGSDDKTARIWDAASGSEIGRLPHVQGVGDVVFSPDGARIATASGENSARIWSDADQAPQHLTHDGGIVSVAFSPDGERAIAGSYDGTARISDLASGEMLHSLPDRSPIWSVAFSRDGQWALTGSHNGEARIWDADSGKLLRVLAHDSADVLSVAFSPDGSLIGTGVHESKAAHVWGAQSGGELHRLPHEGPVASVAFSPDGRRLLTGSSDKTARIWDAASGQELYRLPHEAEVFGVAFSPDGRRALTGANDGKAYLWDLP